MVVGASDIIQWKQDPANYSSVYIYVYTRKNKESGRLIRIRMNDSHVSQLSASVIDVPTRKVDVLIVDGEGMQVAGAIPLDGMMRPRAKTGPLLRSPAQNGQRPQVTSVQPLDLEPGIATEKVRYAISRGQAYEHNGQWLTAGGWGNVQEWASVDADVIEQTETPAPTRSYVPPAGPAAPRQRMGKGVIVAVLMGVLLVVAGLVLIGGDPEPIPPSSVPPPVPSPVPPKPVPGRLSQVKPEFQQCISEGMAKFGPLAGQTGDFKSVANMEVKCFIHYQCVTKTDGGSTNDFSYLSQQLNENLSCPSPEIAEEVTSLKYPGFRAFFKGLSFR